MKSIKPYLLGWAGGLLVGMILMDRWQRRNDLAAEDLEVAVETDAASTAMTVSSDQPRVTTVIIAGAKADAERARQFLVRVVPRGGGYALGLAGRRGRTPATFPDDDRSTGTPQ